MTRSIAGWKLEGSDREALLGRFPPRYERTIADHVTLRSGTNEGTPLPIASPGKIVGEADDGMGVQALIVSIGDTTARGDGSHFHITWSLGPERKQRCYQSAELAADRSAGRDRAHTGALEGISVMTEQRSPRRIGQGLAS